MPKRAIIRRTNRVRSGSRRSGGGTRENGWNCLVLAVALLAGAPATVTISFWLALKLAAAGP